MIFCFSKICKLIFVLGKNIFYQILFFGNFYCMSVIAVNVCVQIYFLMQFFLYYPLQKNKNKTLFGKSVLPLFSIFLINFLWSSNPWRSLEYSQNGQKNKYLGNNCLFLFLMKTYILSPEPLMTNNYLVI